MNATETHTLHESLVDSAPGGMAGAVVTESVGAIAVVILTIIGLAGVLSNFMAAISTIVIGVVLLMQGGLIGVGWRRLHGQGATERQALEMRGGVTAEFFAGFAGVVLGILALFQAMPQTLLAVALLVFGGALLLGSLAYTRLNWPIDLQASVPSMPGSALPICYSGHLFIALGTLVLGILATIGLAPTTLSLVGLLSLGAAAFFTGPFDH